MCDRLASLGWTRLLENKALRGNKTRASLPSFVNKIINVKCRVCRIKNCFTSNIYIRSILNKIKLNKNFDLLRTKFKIVNIKYPKMLENFKN